MTLSRSAPAFFAVLWLAAAPARAAQDAAAVDSADAKHQQTDAAHSPTSQSADYDEIVIIASPHPRRRFDVIQGTAVISHEELDRGLQATLGETLAELPGVSSSYFGPGASRPVIRGFEGPRVRVLQNGMGALDASVTSPDHAVTVDPLQAARVEIIRGAGTLLYGSAAVGGVVNVDDGRIPTRLPEEYVEGSARGLYGTAAAEKSVGAGVTAGLGPTALRAAGFFRSADDLSIPGFPVSSEFAALNPDVGRGPEGSVPNSDMESKGGTLGGSWIFDAGVLGAAYGVVDSNYGVASTPDEPVRIALDQRRVDALGEWNREFALFDHARAQVAYASYEHEEIESGEIGTRFDNEAWEGRLELVQKEWKSLHGVAGFQFLSRDYAAIGEEAFIPPNETLMWGLFAVEEAHLDPFIFEAGLRYERQESRSSALGVDRSFDAVSFSAAAGWSPREDILFGLSVSRTERPPSAEELFSNGPHLATRGFDVGDPTLDEEKGLTLEATARKREGRVTGGINVYYTYFDDFIFLESIGFVDEDGNPDPDGDLIRREYRHSTADFYGGEFQLAAEAIQRDRFTGIVDLALDYVHAEEKSNEEPLPRIPPLRFKAGIEGRSDYLDGRVELWWVSEQDRVARFELPTDGYYLLNASLTLHPFANERDVTLLVQGRNLTDQEARNHVSFVKDFVPLPGRDVRLALRVGF
jgi:iron complex outermembrane receptor protein